jgi:uncharacterized heparinase superfamily protein
MNLDHYFPTENKPVFNRLNFRYDYAATELAIERNRFNFLNLSHQFESDIDWDYQGFGKLWNYNLQYFNYLHQTNLDEKTKQALLLDITHWLKSGKLKLEPYPVSLRVINILRYCSVYNCENDLIINSTFAQLRYLSRNLEYHLLGNHLLENGFALLMGGSAFSEQGWLDMAKNILYKQLEEQILNDGGHFELSPMYHQIILFRVLEAIDWYQMAKLPDEEFLSFIRIKASKMLSWLKAITFSNGDIPHFNDSSDKVALTSCELFNYAKMLDIPDFGDIKLGDSGYRKYMLGSYECAIDVGKIGPSYQPGHSHSDALTFVLYQKGRPFIVDVGTSTYQIGERRNYERSTAAHNTVEVKGTNQSEVWGGFRVGKRASVNIDSETGIQLSASHDGYRHNFGLIHKRTFDFNPQSILITDEIAGDAAKCRIHFHPDCNVELVGLGSVVVAGFANIILHNAGKVLLETYEYANGFNSYLPAKRLVIDFNNTLTTHISLNN